jgi:PIN domain nuclease of toxin-antitoxin system
MRLLLDTHIAIWAVVGGGRPPMPFGAREADAFFVAASFARLPLRPEHFFELELLPSVHRDPFDRALVAQAKAEPMPLISHDAAVLAYL